jgi:hypothetical protein
MLAGDLTMAGDTPGYTFSPTAYEFEGQANPALTNSNFIGTAN